VLTDFPPHPRTKVAINTNVFTRMSSQPKTRILATSSQILY
jgi:hypothetical protein